MDCNICCDKYVSNKALNLPKLLPCGQTFCAACIGKLIEDTSRSLRCPVCKATLPIELFCLDFEIFFCYLDFWRKLLVAPSGYIKRGQLKLKFFF